MIQKTMKTNAHLTYFDLRKQHQKVLPHVSAKYIKLTIEAKIQDDEFIAINRIYVHEQDIRDKF
jgi:hypothetical protein